MAFDKVFLSRGAIGRIALCVLLASTGFGVAGCEEDAKNRKLIDQRANEAQESLDNARKVEHPVIYDPLLVTNKIWSGNTALRMQRGLPLPSSYEGPRGVTLVSADPMSLTDIATAISAQTGIPVSLSALTVPTKAGSSAPANNAVLNDKMPMSYEGPLSGLLERVGANFSVSWRYDGSSIAISRYETRIFTVEALPGTQEINEGMQDDQSSGSSGSSSGSSGSSGSSQQNTLTQNSKTAMSIKYWDELSQVLTSLIGGQGEIVTSPSMGTVTVTTTPEVMGTVADYLAKENHRLARQIAINVQIYSVTLDQSEDYSMAFEGFLHNIQHFGGITYTSAAVPGVTNGALTASNFGQLSIAVLNNSGTPSSHASDILAALSQIGDVTNVAQFPMTTLNNRPVARRVGTDTAYIATVTANTTSSAAGNVVNYSPTVSTIHDGFSLQLTPRLLDDGRILLQYSLSLIGIDNLGTTTFNTGGSGTVPITLPVTDNRIFVQQSMLRSGSTLVIGGVDQEKMNQTHQGVGSPDNFLLGGGLSNNRNHFMMFMAITPQVMDVGGEDPN